MKRHLINAAISVVLPILLSAGMLLIKPGGTLGVNQGWVWILTAWQICALAAVGRSWQTGWLHGASVQACWITYAIATTQYGFIPGSALSIVVQAYSYVKATQPTPAVSAEVEPVSMEVGPVRWSDR